MSKNENVVCFRDLELKQKLLLRGESAGEIANRDLDRYYKLLQWQLRTVQLTKAEAMLICDALNGLIHSFDLDPQQVLCIEIQDALAWESLEVKWEVDKAEILSKLRALNILQAAAIIDAVERFWEAVSTGRNNDNQELIQEVGLF